MSIDIASIDAFGKSSGIYAFMNTAWAWPLAESVHYISLALLLSTVGWFDLRMLGVAKEVPLTSLHRFVPLGVLGFVCNVLTGLLFFVSAPDQYAYNPAFQLKLACIAIACINVAVFYSTTARAVKGLAPDDAVPLRAKIIASISLLSWLGVIVFGRIITYFRPPYHWCFWCA